MDRLTEIYQRIDGYFPNPTKLFEDWLNGDIAPDPELNWKYTINPMLNTLIINNEHHLAELVLDKASQYYRCTSQLAKKEHVDKIQYLIENQYLTNKEALNELLFWCAMEDNLETARLIINNGADINYSQYEKTILDRACKYSSIQFIEYLLELGADPNSNNNSALVEVIKRQDIVIIKLLLGKISDINADDSVAMAEAAIQDNLEIVKLLVESGSNVNSNEWSILGVASELGHLDIIQYLVNCGANTNDDNILIDAVCSKNIDVVQFFLDMNIVKEINDALGTAICINNIPIISLLLSNGAQLEGVDIQFQEYDKVDIFPITQLLLQYFPDETYFHEPFMERACLEGSMETVQLLRQHGYDINNKSRHQLLKNVIKSKNYELFKIFEINNSDNLSQLFVTAIKYDQIKMVQHLVDLGVNYSDDNYYSLRLAIFCSSINSIKLLLNLIRYVPDMKYWVSFSWMEHNTHETMVEYGIRYYYVHESKFKNVKEDFPDSSGEDSSSDNYCEKNEECVPGDYC
jgi:ankyrin repeat protein